MPAIWIVLALLCFQMTKDDAVKLAIGALARHLGVGADRVQLRRATAVDWPDSSLGCPKEGESYLQAIQGATPFLCESPAGVRPSLP